MSSIFSMEDLSTGDWQLEQSLGLTLFDDPWRALGPGDGSSDLIKPDPGAPDVLEDLLSTPIEPLGDPFYEEWMEQTGIAQMLDHLVQETKSETVDETWFQLASDQLLRRDIDDLDVLQNLAEQSIEPDDQPPATDVEQAPDMQMGPVVSLDSSRMDLQPLSPIHVTDMDGIINSPLSAEDVESLLSGSEPSSPLSGSEKEPDLYQLISSTSKNTSKTVQTSPYSRTRSERSVKKKVKTVSASEELHIEFMDKKDKKKLQNKNAAIRYRMKKKAESDAVKSEEDELQQTNQELKDKVEQLQREIQYMKDLMTEVYKAKGIVKG